MAAKDQDVLQMSIGARKDGPQKELERTRALAEILAAVLARIDNLLSRGVTEEELDRILQQTSCNISKEAARKVLNICQQQAKKSVRDNSQAYAAVSFVTGDKTQQHVDAIASITDVKPDDKSCLESTKGEEADIFVTAGGDLPCQFVYNVLTRTLPLTEEKLRSLTDGVLRQAENDRISSIAIPPTGYGMDSLSTGVLARSIIDTALNHSSLSLDEIVVYADEGEVELIKIDKRPQLGEGRPLGSSFSVTIVKADIVHQDVDVIVNSTTSSLSLGCGQLSASIYKAAGDSIQKECRRNYPTGVKTEEIAETSAGLLPSRRIYHTSLGGWSEQNYRAFFVKCLIRASTSNLKSIAFPLIGTGMLKYPCDKVVKCIFESFDEFKTSNPQTSLYEARVVVYPEDTKSLEIFGGVPPIEGVEVPVVSAAHECTLQTAVGISGHIQLPAHWSPMTEEQFVSEVQLEPEDKEYTLVARKFNTGVNHQFTIVKIKRIQNRTLYLQNMMLRHQMVTQNPDMDVEQHLWHGTKGDFVTSISVNGFSRSYAKVTRFGKGTYFAVRPSLSTLYAPENANGIMHMFYASVLTGNYTKGASDMEVPPPRDTSNPDIRYDSVVDCMESPRQYVVFNDAQAYPEYLVTFKKC